MRSIDIEVIRTGAGISSTEVLSAVGTHWAGSSLKIGFPVFSRTSLSADVIGVAVIEEAPPGMRWCGIDVESGDILVYGPDAEHVAVHPERARFSFAVLPLDHLDRAASDVDSTITLTKGTVRRLARTEASRPVASLLPSVVRGEAASSTRPVVEPSLLNSVAYMLVAHPGDGDRRSRRLDDRLIVQACVGFAEQVSRIPTLEELSRAAHVSERRLNAAFVATHGVPPYQFLKTWALDLARRRLIEGDPDKVTVSFIAMGAGFGHLGRFARYYRKAYGESPSETLRRDRSLARP